MLANLAHLISHFFYGIRRGNPGGVHVCISVGFAAGHRADQRSGELVLAVFILHRNQFIGIVFRVMATEQGVTQGYRLCILIEVVVARPVHRLPGMKPGADTHRLAETFALICSGALTVGLLQQTETAELTLAAIVDAFTPSEGLSQAIASDFI
ncbi:hypothetical protein D3C78_1410730 [compost metagenome]